MVQLRPVSHCYLFRPAVGSLEQNGQQLLILSDVCHGMSKPCVIDIKVRKTLASSPRPGLRSDLLMDMVSDQVPLLPLNADGPFNSI